MKIDRKTRMKILKGIEHPHLKDVYENLSETVQLMLEGHSEEWFGDEEWEDNMVDFIFTLLMYYGSGDQERAENVVMGLIYKFDMSVGYPMSE